MPGHKDYQTPPGTLCEYCGKNRGFVRFKGKPECQRCQSDRVFKKKYGLPADLPPHNKRHKVLTLILPAAWEDVR